MEVFENVASSGLNIKLPSHRNHVVESAVDVLASDNSARSSFIEKYQASDYISKTVSVLAAKRLVHLYVQCCREESVFDDDVLLSQCCRGIAIHCGNAKCRQFLVRQATLLASKDDDKEKRIRLAQTFFGLATSSSSVDEVVIPSIAIGWTLEQQADPAKELSPQHDWWNELVSFTMANFTSSVELVQDMIRASFPDHHSNFLRTLLLKLRSHPEKALLLAEAFVPYCPDIHSLVDDDFRNCLYEHLVASSRSDTARSAAATCLAALAPESLHTVCCTHRLPTQAAEKQALYEFLSRSDFPDADTTLVSIVLNYLSEAPPAGKNDTTAEAWNVAVIEWMARLGGETTASGIVTSPPLWRVAVERGHAETLALRMTAPTASNKPIDNLYAAYWKVLNGKTVTSTKEWLSAVLDMVPTCSILARVIPVVVPKDHKAIAKCFIWGRLHSEEITVTPEMADKMAPVLVQQWREYEEQRSQLRTKAIMEYEDTTALTTSSLVRKPNYLAMRAVATLTTAVPEALLLLHCYEPMSVITSQVVRVWKALPAAKWVQHLQEWCVSDSLVVQQAAWRILGTLGRLASLQYEEEEEDGDENTSDTETYQAMHGVCVKELGPLLQKRLATALSSVQALTEHDAKLLWMGSGRLVVQESETQSTAAKSNKRLSQEEEWELEIKREIESKKGGGSVKVEVDPKLLAEQDSRRVEVQRILDEYKSSLMAIQSLVASDIEVGNECLTTLSSTVIEAAVSDCLVAKLMLRYNKLAFETLMALTSCVYEIEEKHAVAMTLAIQASSKGAFPGQFEPAAVVMKELDEFAEALSGGSWNLLFPVVQSCLLGPRTPQDCDACLRVLHRHAHVLSGELKDATIVNLRKDMAIAVLELLNYDRSQTFHDPNPYEALVNCYATDDSVSSGEPPFSTAEMSPLLDERGALGSRSCRIGSMMALKAISEEHQKFLKMNPLVESRVWLNCFDEDEAIRSVARSAWADIQDFTEEITEANLPKPSPLYAAPLLALLSHQDSAISSAAAKAYAHAMALHVKSTDRNIESLCTTYIDAFPSEPITDETPVSSLPVAPTPAPKKKIATGLPKKKAVAKKSALAVAGIGRPKVGSKKKSAHAALLKPKKERTLDQATLVSQFKPTGNASDKEEKDSPAKVSVRLGVLRAVGALTTSAVKVELQEQTLKLLTSFLMAYGIADGDEKVKGSARNVLRDIVASFGNSDEAIAFLLPHLESVLKTGVADDSTLGSLSTSKVPKHTDASDRRKEGAVVALGAVALHLSGPENDAKVDATVDMLISALKTPSEEVQQSVADTLVKLMKKGKTQDRAETLITDMLETCLSGPSFAVRRGSAYGLAAAIKGSGITTLKKFEIVKKLNEACSSGDASNKEGSLFAIELLSSRLGLLFEPHVIVLLPSLLRAFSDSSDHVRKAANDASGLIMSKLSAHGVKLVLPAVLAAFADPAWRTKQASIHMLGAMSHLAPKQLATALPKVVPQLTDAFSDTHPKVKSSAQEALHEITSVVKNPEISSISNTLLKALTDPADYTIKALEALIGTEFLHSIDAPSLSLIVPILHRGLRDRGASSKRFSGLICGNISTMVHDPKDFFPYLPTLLPDLQAALLDPIPDVRSTSAKALGSLTRSLGEKVLTDLRPWLLENLRKETSSSAERSGAAQGFTEVMIACGTAVVEDTVRTEILPLRSHVESTTREGVLWVLSFLPSSMGQGFTPLIDSSLPAIINGLSDDSEPVRDVALRAGRVLIRCHGKVHVDKILPCLEDGLSDDDHRIRVASLSLLGDLLSMIGGTQLMKGDGNTQDDIRKAERAQAQIALALGTNTRKRVLSGLYLARSDSVHMVRQSAMQVWKTVVSVTARTLRDILPVLVEKVIVDLASGHEDKTEVAGRCLGDLVTKLGDSVLPRIIPVLRKALDGGDEHTKRGVCVGLSEVIQCSTKEQIMKYIDIVVKLLQDALADEDKVVRTLAASSFQNLHSVVGSRAMDEIVPALMVALETGEQDERARLRALNGLTGILSVRSRELLPYIIPRLIKRPITANHAEVLGGVASVSGNSIHAHLSSIIPAIILELSEIDSSEAREQAIRDCAKSICGSIDTSGVYRLVGEITSKTSSDKAGIRRESCALLQYFISERAEKADFYDDLPVLMREMVYRLNDDDADVLKANHSAWTALSKHVPAEEVVEHVEYTKNLLASMVSDARRRKGGVGDGIFLLPGFNMPKGLEPLVPIYQRGILYGSPELRQLCATGLGELIDLTAAKYLAGPLIIKITGPLLRVVGDRNPSNVKIAIIGTLGKVLVKGGPALRAFVPQFQTTFVKALSDPSRQVRVEAISALSLLMPLSTRVDPLIKELVAGSEGKAEATAVQTATLEALATVLEKGGAKAKLPTSVPSALEAAKELISHSDEGIQEGAAKVLGESCVLLGSETTHETLVALYDETHYGALCAIRRILSSSAGSNVPEDVVSHCRKLVTGLLDDDDSKIREGAFVALGACIGRAANPQSALRSFESKIISTINSKDETMEVIQAVARGLCVALVLIDAKERISFMGLTMMDACLNAVLKSTQRIQQMYNDVLWLALDVTSGEEGLTQYCDLALFDNQRAMKNLFSKVLSRIKAPAALEN